MTQPKPRRWPKRTTQLDALELSPFRPTGPHALLLATLEHPPDGVDADRWPEAHAALVALLKSRERPMSDSVSEGRLTKEEHDANRE